ncbi:Uncharacterised protein [uncultured archaeon]|nr:Uncharacterised protein [uncultured archaeon]
MNFRMWQIWPPEYGDSNNYTTNQEISVLEQSKRSKQAQNLLNNGDLIFIYETKTAPKYKKYPVYFCWDDVDVLGTSNNELYNFLNKYYNINFTKKPKIRKINEKNTIILSDGEKKIILGLNVPHRPPNGKYVEATLIIDERPIKCWADTEDNKLILYDHQYEMRNRKIGRGGIIALAIAESRFIEHIWSDDEYEDVNRNWDLKAEARIIHSGGFVPRKELCKIMDYSTDYTFRGWGIKSIDPYFLKISEYYCSHKAPW